MCEKIQFSDGFGFVQRKLSSLNEAPAFATCSAYFDQPTYSGRRLKQGKQQGNLSDFMKTVDEKFPLIQWKPRKDFYGNPIESMVYLNKYHVEDSFGRIISKEIILTDEGLN